MQMMSSNMYSEGGEELFSSLSQDLPQACCRELSQLQLKSTQVHKEAKDISTQAFVLHFQFEIILDSQKIGEIRMENSCKPSPGFP